MKDVKFNVIRDVKFDDNSGGLSKSKRFLGDDRGKKEQKDTGLVLHSEQEPCALCWREGTSSALQYTVCGKDPRSAPALATNKPLSMPLS